MSKRWCNEKEYKIFKAKLISEQGGAKNLKCFYCGNFVDISLTRGRMIFTIDHLKPKSIYPQLAKKLNNMVVSHLGCNGTKMLNTPEKAVALIRAKKRETRPEWN